MPRNERQSNHKFVTFQYPKFFCQKDRFSSLAEIQQLIKKQKCDEQPQTEKIFRVKKKGIYIYLYCRKCQAKISLILRDKAFTVSRCDIDHKHYINQLPNKLQIENYFNENKDRLGEQQFREEASKKFKLDYQKYYYLLKKTEQNDDNFQALKEYLQKNKFTFKMDWNKQQEEHPQFIVAVSQQMLTNYKNYGQFIYFDKFSQILKNDDDQIIGIFSGQDSRRKPLIFGICVLFKEDKNTYLKILNQFVNIVHNYPQAIITKQDQILTQTLKQFKQTTQFQGYHLLNVDYFLEDTEILLKKLPFKYRPPNWQENFINKLKLIISQKNFVEGKKLLTEFVQQLENESEIDNILENFIEKLNLICFWRIPQIFVGLSRFSNETTNNINDLMNQKFLKKPTKLNLNKGIQVIQNLSHQLTSKSNRHFSITDSQMQTFYEDTKLKPTRLKLENRVYFVFFENYIQARESNHIKNKIKKSFIIQNKITKQVYTVDNGKCNCFYFQKTGIPCSHLITIVYKGGQNKEYYELFHKRWIKTISESQMDVEQDFNIEERVQNKKCTIVSIKNKYAND